MNGRAYTLDVTRDPGFIDLHRGFLGDTNDDGTVNFDDFLVLSQNFGKSGGWNSANFLGDPTVDFNDFLVLSQHFGQSLSGDAFAASPAELSAMSNFFRSQAPVPEPASLAVAALAALAFLTRRKSRAA